MWDIFSEVGAWLKSDAATNPLAYGRGARRTSTVDRAYGFGYSQTGSFLITYINAIQPRVVASDGAPIYDGYLVAVAGGAFIGAAPLNQCTPVPPLGDPRRSLATAGVPVIQVMSQSDYLAGIASRRPDSDTPPDLYRHYEMAGAAHATPEGLLFSARPQDILAAGRAVPPMSCNEGPRSRFPNSIHIDAALQNIESSAHFNIKIDTIREPAAVPGWLVTTARREALRRLQAGRQEVLFDEVPAVDRVGMVRFCTTVDHARNAGWQHRADTGALHAAPAA